MKKELLITANELLTRLMAKGIRVSDMGWNSDKRKLGYSKIRRTADGGYNFSFYYFDINKDNIFIDCPRGFTKLRGYKIVDFDTLLVSLINK